MNREIKFRGKRIDNNVWVCGNLIYSQDAGVDEGFTTLIIPQKDSNCFTYGSNDLGFECWDKVIPETVGQFTGLKDKNGKEIYEGDICNCREYECFGIIKWNEDYAGFYFYVAYEDGTFDEEDLYEYVDELEIIGNVYEDGELLDS